MATLTTNAPISASAFSIFSVIAAIPENFAKAREMERLLAMTDAQLSAKNLRRDGLVEHVFGA